MSAESHETRPIEKEEPGPLANLRHAVAAGELEMHYQPQVSADGQRIVALEALMRWRHPTAGSIPPAVFIPYAEANGLIESLGCWALRQACRDALQWPGVTVAVNASPLQLREQDFVSLVLSQVQASGLETSRLELEITETSVVDDPDGAEVKMRQLRESGIRLALDDFGTGYSSLSYLRRMPWDKVKIDKTFVDGVGFATSAAIVHAVVALARAIGLKVTAEGVETEQQHRFLKIAGCHYLQGFRFSRPLPAAAVSGLLQRWEPVRAA